MKNLLLFVLLIFISEVQLTAQNNGFVIKRGTNIAHFLSQSSKRGAERETFITENDIKKIAEYGFDHVRLPIDEEQMWDENANRHPDAFRLMTNVIDWCKKNKLRVIVDLHILRSHHFNAKVKPLWTEKTEQEKFYNLWRDLSKALHKYPTNLVAYELMNEAVADDPEWWNNLIANAVSVIRETEPQRSIVIGSNKWQQVGTFDDLKVPENDPNIILSFHFYEPFLLTHWNAGWTSLKGYTGPVHYPGTILTQREFNALPEKLQEIVKGWVGKSFDKNWIRNQWEKPLRKAKKLGLPLYCGEFGIITGPPQEDIERWFRDMIDLFVENNVAYANWNYKSGSFGLLDGDAKPRKNYIYIISGKEEQ